jgi:hypothetical protein
MTSIFLHLSKDILLSILGVDCTPKLSNDKTHQMPLPFCVKESNVKINLHYTRLKYPIMSTPFQKALRENEV